MRSSLGFLNWTFQRWRLSPAQGTTLLVCGPGCWLWLAHKHKYHLERRTDAVRGVGPAPQSSSETEEETEKEGQRKRRAACAIIHVPLQQKMQSQLHKHHASTEWQRVLYTESLCSREGARDIERKQMWGDSSKGRKERQRQIERSVTRTL